MMIVIKRNGEKAEFQRSKIRNAILESYIVINSLA